MKYNKLFLLFLFFHLLSCNEIIKDISSPKNPFSGNENITDSLYWEIEQAKNDSSKFEIYINLLEYYIYDSLEISELYLDTLKSISDRNESSFMLGNYHLSKADILDFRGQVKEAEKGYKLATEYLSNNIDPRSQSMAYNNLGYVQNHLGKIQEALISYQKALEIRIELKDSIGISSTYNNIGYVHDLKGNHKEALRNYNLSLEICQKLNYNRGIARGLNNIAFIYQILGDIPKAVNYFEQSIQYFELDHNTAGLSTVYNNIGILNQNQKDYEAALENYQKSLELIEGINDKEAKAKTQSNIGFIYLKTGQYELCKKNYSEALKYLRLYGDKNALAECLVSIGIAIVEMKSKDNPINYFNEAYTLFNAMDNEIGIAQVYSGFSSFYASKGNKEEAFKYAQKYHQLSESSGLPETIGKSSSLLYEIYKSNGDFEKALEYFETSISINKKLDNEKNKKAIINSQYQIEYAKKAAEDSIMSKIDKDLNTLKYESKLEQEEQEKLMLYGGLSLVLVLTLISFRAYTRKKNDNQIIESQKKEVENQRDQAKKSQLFAEEQKLIVEEKNREIVDSIQYAKRLQNAILPNENFITKHLPKHYILYLPKDIVAGDFYWFENIETENIKYIAVADCTGHGVPGALVSIVCSNALSKAVLEENLRQPSEILERVSQIVIKTFEKSGETINDGMDIGLCRIDDKENKLTFSGANIPLIFLQNNPIGHRFELETIKGTKRPIGKYKLDIPFQDHTIKYQEKDRFYMFSDGYADQFGGENMHLNKPGGKKLKSTNLKKMILSIQDKSFEEQKIHMKEMFHQWKGDLEQIDDVCMIGFEPKK